MDPIESDPRFTKLGTDKKFRNVSKKHRKVKIDKRFESLFSQEKFVNKCPVDKRGRPRHLTAKENYEKFYQLDSDEESSEDNEDASDKGDDSDKEDVSDRDNDDKEEDLEKLDKSPEIEDTIKNKLHDNGVDYARGEGTLYSDSSSEEDDSSDDGDSDVSEVEEDTIKEEEFDKWGEMDHEAERTEDITKRLAVCNMDWDRVGADDIFLALSSFCPSGGSVTEVYIYLSEFGKERLEEEQTLGPLELRGNDKVEEEEEDVVADPKKIEEKMKAEMARVRQYQINRLKYYYAVVSFDNADTANRVYTECDGMEYELSATRFDLRFIPDDMEFEDSPKDSCLVRPDQDKYKAKNFETSALQQQKVELTWDETDPNREKTMKKAFEAMDDEDGDLDDVRGLIASASEDDSEGEAINGADDGDNVNDKDIINKYRALLADVQSKEDNDEAEKGNMEVKWDDPEPIEENTEEELGPWEKYLEKKKNKKKKKIKAAITEDGDEEIPDGVDMNDPFFAEELDSSLKPGAEKKKKKKKSKNDINLNSKDDVEDQALDLMVMDSDDEKDHFNFKDIVESETKTGKAKKKWKKKKKELEIPVDDNFTLDVGDNRFSALYSRPDYNIDPTDSNFKKTKNMEKIIGEKLSRLNDDDGQKPVAPPVKKQKLDPDISSTLKSVKNKWKKNAKKNKKLF